MTVAAALQIRADLARTAEPLRELAIRALERMYLSQQGLFAFRLRRTDQGDVLEGVSRRYTAVALIGLAGQPPATARQVLAGHDPLEVCDRLLMDLASMGDLGEVALTLWAGRALGHPRAVLALERLRSMQPQRGACPTVELAWCLTALSVQADAAGDAQLAGAIAQRLVASFQSTSQLFPHWPRGARRPWLRAHVTCFADLVYPIQALSQHHRVAGSAEAMDVARRCARRMCQLQGPDGQWWWHYDVRTGRAVERYPVYAVHQDAMAPMALLAVQQAGGEDCSDAIARGLGWLADAPEIGGSLVDDRASVIWRKVARKEPGKLSRSLQAAASRVHPALRVPGLGMVFRPGRVDYESRPYHMGWILYAWPAPSPAREAEAQPPEGCPAAESARG